MSHNTPSPNAPMDWSNNYASDNARQHMGHESRKSRPFKIGSPVDALKAWYC